MKPNPQEEERSARWTQHVVRQLPPQRAPASLGPSILKRIHESQSVPWYNLPWFRWPKSLQWTLGLIAVGLTVWLTGFLMPSLSSQGMGLLHRLEIEFNLLRKFQLVVEMGSGLGNAVCWILRHLLREILLMTLAVIALLWSSTVGLGMACWKLSSPNR